MIVESVQPLDGSKHMHTQAPLRRVNTKKETLPFAPCEAALPPHLLGRHPSGVRGSLTGAPFVGDRMRVSCGVGPQHAPKGDDVEAGRDVSGASRLATSPSPAQPRARRNMAGSGIGKSGKASDDAFTYRLARKYVKYGSQ